jgi:hypothetical protein
MIEVCVEAKVSILGFKFSLPIVNSSDREPIGFYVGGLDNSAANDWFLRLRTARHIANRKKKFWTDGPAKAKWRGQIQPRSYGIYVGGKLCSIL